MSLKTTSNRSNPHDFDPTFLGKTITLLLAYGVKLYDTPVIRSIFEDTSLASRSELRQAFIAAMNHPAYISSMLLWIGIHTGNIALLESLLEKNFLTREDLKNYSDPGRKTIFLTAAQHGHIHLAKWLLKTALLSFWDITKQKDALENDAFSLAADNHQVDFIEWLFTLSIATEVWNHFLKQFYGFARRLIKKATMTGHDVTLLSPLWKLREKMISWGNSHNHIDNVLICIAAEEGSIGTLWSLVRKGIVNGKNSESFMITVLSSAAEHGYIDLAEWLFNKTTPVAIHICLQRLRLDIFNNTLLLYAAKAGQITFIVLKV